MSRGFWKVFFTALILAGFFVCVGKVAAISLAPALIEVEADAGELLVQKITLFNETDQQITIYPKVENFKTQEGSSAPQFLGDLDPLGAARWIFVPIKKVALKSGERTEILLKIKIPHATEPGGHYSALLWSEKPAEDVGISTSSRVGTLFLFKIKGEAREEAKIISFQNTPDSQPAEFVLRLQNDGNVHLKPGGTIEISNWRGKTIAQLPINSKGQSILPQSQRNFVMTFTKGKFFPGWYSARADVAYGVSAKTLSTEVNFWFWPDGFGNKILVLILVLLLGGLIFKMARRRARYLFFILLLLSYFLVLPVLAATTSTGGTTTVSASVPTQSSSGGGGGGGGDEPPPDGIPPDEPPPEEVPPPEEEKKPELDVLAPVIDSISVIPQVFWAEISWHTDESADSQVVYGLTNQLGQLAADSALTVNHKITLSNLTPNTTYYFKVISSDASGNQAVGLIDGAQIGTFKTLNDTKPPANVSAFKATAGDKKIGLSWENPPDSDFAGVVIVRKTNGFPVNINDGSVFPLINGAPSQNDSAVDDQGIVNSVTYYYTAFAGDKYGNYASGAIAQATPQAGEELPVVPEPVIPKPDETLPPPEDDGEETAPGENLPAAGEPGSEGAGGGSQIEGLQLGDFNFTAVKGQIIVQASFQFSALVGSGIGVVLSKNKTPKEIESIVLSVANSFYLFNFSESKQTWQTEFVTPAIQDIYPAKLSIKFIDQTTGVFNWQFQSLPYGQIYEKKNGQKIFLSGAKVSLYYQNQLWPAVSFYQNNPQRTGADGLFGFIIPPGKYLLKIEKAGYSTETIDINIGGIVVNLSIELLYLPPKIKDVINPEASLAENVSNVAQNLGEQAVFISKKVFKEINYGARQAVDTAKEIVQNPEAQKIAKDVAAPVVASAAAAGTAAIIGWAQLLGYLRFLFTQPILLIKRRKRHGWGVVYNSLTKLPLDLIIVRLVDTNSGKIAQTRVTDSHGRYVFFPPVGSYHLETNANQFKFPSVFLGAVKDDSDFLDLYHGEMIEVKEAGVAITANIPLDPLGAELPLWKLVGRLAWRRLQHFFSILSLLIALGFAIWVPSTVTIGLLVAQAVFYSLFLRLAIPRKPKSWGIVYDEKTRKPLARTVARIFDKQYNKLLETQVTDKTGRYSFLVGRNQYYVSYEKEGYEKKQSETIDLQNNSEPVASVGVDADLKQAEYNANIRMKTNATNNTDNPQSDDSAAVDK